MRLPLAVLGCVLIGSFIGYSIGTVICWDVDNQFPTLHPHMTLAHWIWVNHIKHVWQMLHELW